jgi:hypothetical protein
MSNLSFVSRSRRNPAYRVVFGFLAITIALGSIAYAAPVTYTAFTITDGQLYVYYDVTHGSIGFGSAAGGRGYPLSLTANHDNGGMVENSWRPCR